MNRMTIAAIVILFIVPPFSSLTIDATWYIAFFFGIPRSFSSLTDLEITHYKRFPVNFFTFHCHEQYLAERFSNKSNWSFDFMLVYAPWSIPVLCDQQR